MEENEEYSVSESDVSFDENHQPDEQGEDVTSEEHAEVVRRPSGIADSVLAEFSTEGNIERLTRLTKLPANVAAYIMAAVNIIVGLLCIIITDEIAEVLPFIVSGVMLLLGVARLGVAIFKHEYRRAETNLTATAIIVIALGTMILYQGLHDDNQSAITFISIIWGILGLFECAHALNCAFKRIANSERGIYYLLKAIVEGVIAFLLLYNPAGHEIHHVHIIVFGANLIIDAITVIPQVKVLLKIK